ncbi:DUF4328 domain-containing protein [Micromonospora sp. NBC_01796]|uniref:DUF4328 domain-containing protein n=1 Tax=Micromonospora sp. NBC_01796 TaxID=2975987 RepID=UPI002DDB4558|nr:DUF4328 domain-containing protein [Micromonospora sp. NBC_01796]WSA85618.1 DUF4328 domain-containing protein [Micromonospora sp. NBC_01796]
MRCQTCHTEQASTTVSCAVCRTPTGAPAVIPWARTYSLSGVGRATSNALGLAVVAHLLLAAMMIVDSQLVERAKRDLDPDAIDSALFSTGLVGLLFVVPLTAAAVLMIVWCYLARVNLDAFPGAVPTLHKGWAIAGWLVPFVYLVVPPRVVANIVRESVWTSKTQTLVRIWIGSWVVYGIAGVALPIFDIWNFLALPTDLDGPDDYQKHVDYYYFSAVPSTLVPAVLGAVAGVSLIKLINQVSAAQDIRIGRGTPAAPVMPGLATAGA